ncbi:MAG: phospho-N-acetylmuramoyl-pentapeptide-transferase [Firmicutes bacterium]|nr:phospho-N-acetylmuramoyl-pentapeptide-transferase [Bacillota bacterium]
MAKILWAALTAFLIAAVLGKPWIALMKRLKARQTILHYVESHSAKSGVPTMGGPIFVVAAIAAAIAFFDNNFGMALAAAAVTVAYGFLGFLDAFLKIWFKRNLGLYAYQKIIGQALIAGTIGYFAYTNPYIGNEIFVPFSRQTIDLGILMIPFVMVVFLAVTNTVNLIDGLDGLASGVTLPYTAFFAAVVAVTAVWAAAEGAGPAQLNELGNLNILGGAFAGALAGFLLFNAYPAKIFMGDTGSLALGGMAASLAVFTRLELLVLILGLPYVLTGLSVILQVAYFKTTKGKRIFLMAPLHHHFEKKGFHEVKITAWYSILTAALGAACLLVYLSV